MFIRRVLVPVAFSPRARAALDYGCRLAELTDATVDALHVVPPPNAARVALDAYLGRPIPHASTLDVLLAHERLHDLMGACERRGIVPVLHVEAGDVAATIVRVAVELPADVVVMTTRGPGGVAERLLGTVAHRVITCAPCPVVTLAGDAVRTSASASAYARREL
jgi:nucleotide-binding universal stress UspA family protein